MRTPTEKLPGVGAVFYVQIALEVLPDNPESTHLREVITPVVYFLVLTSIIVHGITIPVGKAGYKGISLTTSLTFSRSNTIQTENENSSGGAGGGGGGGFGVGRRAGLNDVSRLPPPILAGMGRLPVRDREADMDNSSPGKGQIPMPDSAGTGMKARPTRDIRFDDDREHDQESRDAEISGVETDQDRGAVWVDGEMPVAAMMASRVSNGGTEQGKL